MTWCSRMIPWTVVLALLVGAVSDAFLLTSAFCPLLSHSRRPTPRAKTATAMTTPTPTPTNAVNRKSFVELTDPETGCQIVLLGCFHGSNSSAADVAATISPDTDVVVMELCAGRFADLRRDYLSRQLRESQVDAAIPQPSNRPWILRLASMVRKTAASRGWAAGAATAVLGSVTGAQTALSGLVPGLEFTVALEKALETQAAVVLADQVVDETLHKIGNLPVTSVSMWRDFLTSRDWQSTFGREAAALQTAVAGNGSPQQVTLPAFLTRTRTATADMVRSILPPFILLQSAVYTANIVSETFLSPSTANAAVDASNSLAAIDSGPAAALLGSLALTAANLGVLALVFVSIALPATGVVLRERDDTLYMGIREACRLAATAAAAKNDQQPGKVVAVLGLLHVNGVAARILASSDAATAEAVPTLAGTTNSTQFDPVELGNLSA